MGGIIGRLFHEFAVVIMVSILISGFVSLSLTPMLCSRFLKPPTEKHNALFRASERVFDGFRDLYGWTLRGVVRHRFITLMVALGTLVATVYLYRVVPTGFIPNQDTGQIQGTTELPQDASFDAMVKSQSEAAAIVQADPNVEGVFSTVNASGGNNGANAGRIFMRLKPRTERKLTPEQIIDEMRPKLNAIPGVRTYLTNPPLIRIGGQQSRSLYQYTLQSQDLKELYHGVRRIRKAPEGSARIVRRQQRPSDYQPGSDRGYRSRPCFGVGRHRGPDRRRPIQRVRFAAGFRHLYANQRLLGIAGDASAIPARS